MKQRLIDANALRYHMGVNQNDKQIFYITGEDIDAAPTIDPESLRPHGEWVKDQFSYRYLCTNCKMTLPEWLGVFNYCPSCGAKMEEKGDES